LQVISNGFGLQAGYVAVTGFRALSTTSTSPLHLDAAVCLPACPCCAEVFPIGGDISTVTRKPSFDISTTAFVNRAGIVIIVRIIGKWSPPPAPSTLRMV
jgi:hypothetical protein